MKRQDQLSGAAASASAGGLKTPKNEAAVALGRLGGKKGGTARAQALTSQQRADIARKAALTRWSKLASE